MNKILITGAARSIGKELLKNLLHKFEVICAFDNNEDGLFQLRKEINTQFPKLNYKVKYLLGDVRDQKRLSRALNKIDIVIHSAALKQVPLAEYKPIEFIKTNILTLSKKGI